MDEEYVIAAVVAEEREYGEGEGEKMYLKRLRDGSNPFDRSERKFRKLFRLSRAMGRHVVDTLCEGDALRAGTVPPHLKVLSALNFFAHGSYQTAVGEINILAQSQPTISRSLADVCPVIIERLTPQWIKFPVTRLEKDRAMREFQDNFGMPYTLGAVDGSHIPIHKPPNNHPIAPGNIFYNRKGFYSINCQVVCDATGRITSVNPNFPGSTHDAAVWRSSNVHQHLEGQYLQNQAMEWLLGDKGYPLLPWLMTPHPDPVAESPEARFNRCHAQARGVIEMCFGVLKNKFRCLHRHRTLHYSPEKAAKIIISCCTIYNMINELEINHDSDSSDDSESDEDITDLSEVEEDDEEQNDPEDLPQQPENDVNFFNEARGRRRPPDRVGFTKKPSPPRNDAVPRSVLFKLTS
ncbi:putative nuclease HARBI1 [Cydia amplana]|uniref:putative nuclease HARBI1 n=1 Tax=Cydia amplana TaxID=1869771 RepID=UPI002FE5A750